METPPQSPNKRAVGNVKRSGSKRVIRRIRSFADLQVKRSRSFTKSVGDLYHINTDGTLSPKASPENPMSLSWSFVARETNDDSSVELLPFSKVNAQSPTFRFVSVAPLLFDPTSATTGAPLASLPERSVSPPLLSKSRTPTVGPKSPSLAARELPDFDILSVADDTVPLDEANLSTAKDKEFKELDAQAAPALRLKPSLLFKRWKQRRLRGQRSQSDTDITISTKPDIGAEIDTKKRYSDSFQEYPALFCGPGPIANRKFSLASVQTGSSSSTVSDLTVLSSISDEASNVESVRNSMVQLSLDRQPERAIVYTNNAREKKFVSFKEPPERWFQYNDSETFSKKHKRGKAHKMKKMLRSIGANLLAQFQPSKQPPPTALKTQHCRSQANLFSSRHRVAPAITVSAPFDPLSCNSSIKSIDTNGTLIQSPRHSMRTRSSVDFGQQTYDRRNSVPIVHLSSSSYQASGHSFARGTPPSDPNVGNFDANSPASPAGPASTGTSQTPLDDGKASTGLSKTLGWAFDSFWSWMGYPGEEEFALEGESSDRLGYSPRRRLHPRSRSQPVEGKESSSELTTPNRAFLSPEPSVLNLDKAEVFGTVPSLFSPEPEKLFPLQLLGRHDQSVDGLLHDSEAELLRTHLPANQREATKWNLVYSLEQHGVSLNTLYHRAQAIKTGLMLVIKDTGGSLFGAYLSDSLRPSVGYYGTGQCFLWKSLCNGDKAVTHESTGTSSAGAESESQVQVYHATGINEYLIHSEVNFIALGGGDGAFGLWIDQELLNGFSNPCPTFNNPCLSTTPQFKCQGLELWTFCF